MKKTFKIILGIFVLLGIMGAYYLFNKPIASESAVSTITVTDSVGRQVVVPKHPQRVIILNPSNLEIYYAAGGKAIAKPNTNSFNEELQGKIKDLPETGMIHSPNLEKILSLKPDLIIGTDVPYHNAIIPPLTEAGIPVLINSIKSYEDVLQTLTFFGQLANTEKLSEAKRAEIEAEYQAVIAAVKGKIPPRSLIIFGSPDSFSMATKKSFSGNLINILGGGNIADAVSDRTDAYVGLSMEYITQQNPEIIFLITMGNAAQVSNNLKKDMAENSIWQGVSAVKTGRIYELPANLFTVNPGTQVAEAMSILSSYLYPEVAANGK